MVLHADGSVDFALWQTAVQESYCERLSTCGRRQENEQAPEKLSRSQLHLAVVRRRCSEVHKRRERGERGMYTKRVSLFVQIVLGELACGSRRANEVQRGRRRFGDPRCLLAVVQRVSILCRKLSIGGERVQKHVSFFSFFLFFLLWESLFCVEGKRKMMTITVISCWVRIRARKKNGKRNRERKRGNEKIFSSLSFLFLLFFVFLSFPSTSLVLFPFFVNFSFCAPRWLTRGSEFFFAPHTASTFSLSLSLSSSSIRFLVVWYEVTVPPGAYCASERR